MKFCSVAGIWTLVFVVPTTSQEVYQGSSSRCTANQYATYRLVLQICDGGIWRNLQGGGGRPNTSKALGRSCLDIKKKGLSHGDGEYVIDPFGPKAFSVYCDMTSFGGGWTMCYTTDSEVDIRTELTTTRELGYRADCNNIPFTSVLFVDEKTKRKAAFRKSGPPVTFRGNYNKKADAYGLWTAQGVASSKLHYQFLICDTAFNKGLHVSGYTNCFKQCDSWCSDKTSPYFRTSKVKSKTFNGVAFNENGHRPLPNRLISAGIR